MVGIFWDFFYELVIYLGLFFVVLVLLYFLFNCIDKGEKKCFEELFYQFWYDDFIGLLNWVGLIDQIYICINSYKLFSMVLVDIDNFWGINDCFGQDFGDWVLVEWFCCLCINVGEQVVVVSLGGDEFVVVMLLCELDQVFNYCWWLFIDISNCIQVGFLEL